MADKKVDLGEIRGDWDFHSRYAANAMEQTLKRVNKLWRSLKRASPAAGMVPVSGPAMDEFIEACSQTRALCDDFALLEEARPPKRTRKKKSKARRKAR